MAQEFQLQPSPFQRTSGTVQPGGVFDSWTPTVTFAVPGDLSVVYSTQDARYTRLGNQVFISYRVRFTPTFTTSGSNFYITGIPVFDSTFTIASYDGPCYTSIPPTGGRTWITAAYGFNGSVPVIGLNQHGGGAGSVPIEVASFTSGLQYEVRGQMFYYVTKN